MYLSFLQQQNFRLMFIIYMYNMIMTSQGDFNETSYLVNMIISDIKNSPMTGQQNPNTSKSYMFHTFAYLWSATQDEVVLAVCT